MAGIEDMEYQTILSLRLYDILENVGASEKMRKLHKRTSTLTEIIKDVYDKPVLHYICGSTYEGSVTPDLSSDIDSIMCLTNPPVVLEPLAAPPGYSLLMVRDEWTCPGYVKLQVMWNRVPLTGDHPVSPKYCAIDAGNRYCVRHFEETDKDSPAKKFVDNNGIHMQDLVGAFKCNSLPVCACNRLDKLRRRGLLSNEELEKMNGIGCMLVCAGYFRSPDQDCEWRLSLSLQERYFMSKLNPTQHKVYVLLKLIKRNIIEKVFGCESLTSYHCKTCVLYAVEMTQTRNWTPDNLIKCLMQCLKLLILWLKHGFCPNYFNSSHNLFSKKGFSESRQQLLHILELIPMTKNEFLALLRTDHIWDMLVEEEDRWRNEIETSNNSHIYTLNVRAVTSLLFYFPHIMNQLCDGHCKVLTLISALKLIQETETITEHTAAETRAALRYLQPWFHLHIAKSVASLSFTYHAKYKRKMMKLAELHLRKANMTDLVNVKLSTASIMFKSEQYEACFSLLQHVENLYTYKVTRICPCTRPNSVVFYDLQEQHDRQKTMSSLSLGKLMKRFFACCVTFLPSQLQIVPTPLKYEMFRSLGTQPGSTDEYEDVWFDWCVVDPKVYLYLMQYLASTKLHKEAHKQAAMDNIRAIIEKDNIPVVRQFEFRQLGHPETAYNILGWIYIQEQRYGDAVQCFLKSWEIRPFHNAAKFHMRDLMTAMLERG